MAFEGRPSALGAVLIYSETIGINIVLYAGIAWGCALIYARIGGRLQSSYPGRTGLGFGIKLDAGALTRRDRNRADLSRRERRIRDSSLCSE